MVWNGEKRYGNHILYGCTPGKYLYTAECCVYDPVLSHSCCIVLVCGIFLTNSEQVRDFHLNVLWVVLALKSFIYYSLLL